MIKRSLRYCYGRGVARVPVSVPKAHLEMVPLRPSREIVAAISPLYLAALIPASLLFVMSIFVVEMDEPVSSPVLITDFEPLPAPVPTIAASPAPVAKPQQPAVLEEQPEPQSLATTALEDVVVEIEIDAIESVERAPVPVRTAPVVAALRVSPGRSNTAARELAPMEAEAPPLALPDPASVQRQTTSLPSVSLAGPAPRPTLEAVAAERPTTLGSGLEGASAVAIANIPEPASPEGSGLGFEPVARAGATGPRPVDGVPLETLVACRSREREDVLKQELMHVVSAGRQCRGHGGTYRFLEAKNLNAFSMGVTNDPGRELGNRCEELERAQACVDDQRSGRVQP